MSLTYGYDLKKKDKMLEAPEQAFKLMGPVFRPGALNYLPFCAVFSSIPVMPVVSNSNFQCGTFLHGSHTSATNHWREKLGR
jgi:hypothetical protein